MLGIFAKTDELDWTQDPTVGEAMAARQEAQRVCDVAKRAWDDAWQRWGIPGVPLSFDSPAVPARQVFLAATQALDDADAALRTVEAQAKAAARVAWLDKYRTEWEAVEHATDQLLDVLTVLDESYRRAESLGIVLTWATADAMTPASVANWRDMNRREIEKL